MEEGRGVERMRRREVKKERRGRETNGSEKEGKKEGRRKWKGVKREFMKGN